jgi:hypothetical protein
MNSQDFIWSYVQMCGAGKLPLVECAPVWQIGDIGLILAFAIVFLVMLRIRASAKSAQSQ